MSDAVRAELDGEAQSLEHGATYLEAFAQRGVVLPTLCHEPRLRPVGSCGVCAVEVQPLGEVKWRRVPACATRVENGARARSSSPLLDDARRLAVQVLLDRHDPALRHHPERAAKGQFPLVCACRGHASCHLRAVCRDLGALPQRAERAPARPPVALSLWLELEPSKCVLCERCVRACTELVGVGALGLVGRGDRLQVVHALASGSPRIAACDECAQGNPPCVDLCPTAALHPPYPAKRGPT